jgi:hypothetical protein
MNTNKTILVLFLSAVGFAQEPYAGLREGGPLALAIAYKCNPDQRPALRQIMIHGGVAQFQSWKEQGILKDYHILFNSYLDSETYDMVSLLVFPTYSAVSKWRDIEKKAPGGLPEAALKLVNTAVTYSLDGARSGAAQELPQRGQSVYFLIPYDYVVSTDEYLKYLDTYVVPQLKGWIKEKVLASYTIYISRYSTSRPWGSIFFLEYRDSDSFGKRESTVAKVRERLQADPAWLAASQNKQKIRIEKQTIVAEELVAGR